MTRHFERDQLILPFAEKEYVSVSRTARILGVGLSTVHRMADPVERGGYGTLTAVSYRFRGQKRILYSSIVRFCDNLRARYGIQDRRPPLDHPIFRHRDADLLPFPLADTMGSQEALSALGYESKRPLFYLIEEGRFDAYMMGPEAVWRISRSSFRRFLAETRDRAS